MGEAAARTVKRTCLELGGKSANIVLTDGDLEKAARWNIQRGFSNTGQSCHAPSRLLVHESQVEDILPFLVDEIEQMRVGDPRDPATTHGPLIHAQQFDSIQDHIRVGLEEGGRLVTGGLGRIEDFDRGFFCKPTVLADVTPDMTLATEEIFGPVLVVMPYRTEARGAGDRQRLHLRPRRIRVQRGPQARPTSSPAACAQGGSRTTVPAPTR